MTDEAPSFWWKPKSAAASLLAPAAAVYGHFAAKKMKKARPWQVNAPVLCIGNFTLGGTGKTPLVIAFAKAIKKRGLEPGIVSRGYGGSAGKYSRMHLVDIQHDSARKTGDEPLLLARHAPVMVGTDRAYAARKLVVRGAHFILMDDGFQSRRLHPDYALLAVDSSRGLGNQRVFPAGPLRAPLKAQLAYTDGIIMTGSADSGIQADIARLAREAGKDFTEAGFQSFISRAYQGVTGEAENLKQPIARLEMIKGRRFFAFAGLGNPQKFYRSIEALGGTVAQIKSFPDHHFFTPEEVDAIAGGARANGLVIVTTAKDYIRLGNLAEKFGDVLALDIAVNFADKTFCDRVLDLCISRFEERGPV